MALNFPANPTIGDEYSAGGFTWTWSGSSWDKIASAAVGIPSGETADRPASPAIGDQFYNGTLGVLEIYTVTGWLPATGANDFNIVLTGSETSVTLDKQYFSGAYTISSSLSDITFDVYLFDTSNNPAGYSKTPSINATSDFNKIVVYGGTVGDLLSFSYKTTFTTSETTTDTFAAPYITSISNTELQSIDDSTTITGGNFDTDIQVWFDGQNSYSQQAKSVVYGSSTSVVATRPDSLSVADEPFTVRLVNPGIPESGGSNKHKLINSVTVGSAPIWDTPAGLLPVAPLAIGYSSSLQATDPDGQSITYSITSGSLIPGLSLNTTTGEIFGTPTSESSSEFTVEATDSAGKTTSRSFIIATSIATGGTVTQIAGYQVHTFESNGTFSLNAPKEIEYLIVGGGGGGGARYMGGGGGAGGFRTNVPGSTSGRNSSPEASVTLQKGQYTVVIGAGGTANESDTVASATGNSSSFISIESLGGGAGGRQQTGPWQGQNGGSGGGDTGYQNGGGGLGTANQGFDGGDGATYGGGGGGGAGGNGSNGTAADGGVGGIGIQSPISGTTTYYAGGGGGGDYNGTGAASGGLGGGGAGAPGPSNTSGGTPTAGLPNTGGGGGGANGYQNTPDAIRGATGGSGVVIVRYAV